jgi:hypothetical protein
MNKLGWVIVMFVACGVCEGQNLVPNPSFETLINCPTGISSACSYPFFDMIAFSTTYWHNIGCGSADYFNSCNTIDVGIPQNFRGYQNARTGVAYIGEICGDYYREIVGTFLTATLISNVDYYVEFYVSRAPVLPPPSYPDSSDVLGALFTIGEPDTTGSGVGGILLSTAQVNNPDSNFLSDTLTWMKVSGVFTASGGENFISIGNFKEDTSHTHGWGYYYIDDVSVTTSTGINKMNQNISVNIYPTIFNQILNIKINNTQISTIILSDITSREIMQLKFTNSVTLSTELLAKGIYLYEVRNKNGVIKKGKVVKD